MRGASFTGRWIGSGWSRAQALVSRARAHTQRLPAGLTRAEIATQLADDYSTGQSEPVPAVARRPMLDLAALWVTLAAGLPELALGWWYYQAGYPLGRAVAAGAAAGGCYLAYALPAAYLGSRTGRTTAVLARTVFGTTASAVVSAVLIAFAAGRVALASAVLAGVYQGLLGWGHVALIGAAAAAAGMAASLLGFTGNTAFARYVAAPLMVAWIGYVVVRGIEATPYQLLADGPKALIALPFPAAVGLAIAVAAWGNEPDTWRYGRSKFLWPALPYLAALAVGLVLFVAGGWVIASMSHPGAPDLVRAYRSGASWSVFGALWLGAALVTVMQLGRSGGGYYQMTNAIQNLLGEVRGWRRWHSCLLLAALSAVITWGFIASGATVTASGASRVAEWSAVVLPSVVVVMCVHMLALARSQDTADPERQAGRESPPDGSSGGRVSWPGIVAVLAAAALGSFGLGLLPGQHSQPVIGFAPVAAWLLAGLLYATIRMAQRAGATSPADTATLRWLRYIRLGASLPPAARLGTARARTGPSARDMLDLIHSDAAAEVAENRFLPLVASGRAARERLLGFAVQQTRLRSSDRRSILYLASRSGHPASVFFAGLAETEQHALDLLDTLAAALDGKAALASEEPLAGCQAYPAYVAWLALNAPPADAVLALTASLATWAGPLETMGRALREHPGYGLDERACAFFDLVAAPAPQLETDALAVVQGHIDAGRPPVRARAYARLLRAYGHMFWDALADDRLAPGPARRQRPKARPARQKS
jgi:purine-cytosine permease-like protein